MVGLRGIVTGASVAIGVMGAAGGALACPSWANNGQQAILSGPDLAGNGRSFAVAAGGTERLTGCGIPFGSDQGDGYVTRDPDFTFDISGMSGRKLVLSTYSECDSVLVINTGTESWFYDDDDNGDSALDARIVLSRPRDGIYDVWVGTHDGSVCDAFLVVQTARR